MESQRAWVACMRGKGFDLPDPDAKGMVDGSAVIGPVKAQPRTLAAFEACEHLSTEVPEVLQPREEPLTAEQLANLRRYSACRREHGSPDYPDPLPDGGMPSFGGELTPQEQEADERSLLLCDPVLSGQPPATVLPTVRPQG